MKQYTLEEYTKIYGFNFYVYDKTPEDYLMGERDTIIPDSEEWERIKDEVIIGIDEYPNEVPVLIIATYSEEDEPQEYEEPTRDDIYRDNGFASEADFWRWKEGR